MSSQPGKELAERVYRMAANQVSRYRDLGLSQREIATLVGRSVEYVRTVVRELGDSRPILHSTRGQITRVSRKSVARTLYQYTLRGLTAAELVRLTGWDLAEVYQLLTEAEQANAIK